MKKTPPKLSQEDRIFAKSLLIYEDKWLLVFNKPTGLASQSGKNLRTDLETLSYSFFKGDKHPFLVHRLDIETSGIVIIAKTKTAARYFSEQFASQETKKTYMALVSGCPPENGTINAPLKRARIGKIDLSLIAKEDDSDAQKAITHFKTIKTFKNCTLLEVSPQTGRMHQIRAHLSHINHAILGDSKYGGKFMLEDLKIPRLLLHSKVLQIDSFDGTKYFEAPLPQDFTKILEILDANHT